MKQIIVPARVDLTGAVIQWHNYFTPLDLAPNPIELVEAI